MANMDLYNDIGIVRGISPVVVTDNTAQVSEIIDTQGYGSVTFGILTGTLADADATFTVLLEEGDNSALSDAAAVADSDLVGTEAGASFTFAADNATRKLGYTGSKRYVRLTITPAGNSGNAPLAAFAVLGHPSVSPVA